MSILNSFLLFYLISKATLLGTSLLLFRELLTGKYIICFVPLLLPTNNVFGSNGFMLMILLWSISVKEFELFIYGKDVIFNVYLRDAS